MNSRNFKVRIENLNLKKTVFLETSAYSSDVMVKYRDMLNRLGYNYIRSNRQRGGKVHVYYFYPKAIFPTLKHYYAKFPRRRPVMVAVPGVRGRARWKPVSFQTNQYLVELHIVELNVKHPPKK